ncbi:hypothetical protein N6B72_17025 [Chryseobacterium soli]|uniref:hypothetical protein n=1 Tax=Chryseobacterium soli TaxID=445961 RepID=UPI002953A5DE|nr:hypothetical protein [Chryseobacterium soli]MDV7698630.1 hypothetical protein [Chryseobacterium soli]
MYKKIIIVVGLLIAATTLYNAQMSIGSAQKQTILSFPTSPDAYSFGKVDNLPIDYFKGQANIGIPIYTIQIDNLSIPISLRYNTGGIKQNEIASSVGLGWTLSIPNRILKSIEGMDDEKSNLYFKDFTQADTYYSNSPYDLTNPASDLFYNNLMDAKPDLYSYSLAGSNGSFIVNENKGHTIPHEDIKIFTENSTIKVIDNNGNTFKLTPKNLVTTGRRGDLAETSSNLYLVDSIKTNRNNIVKFEYTKNQSYIEKTKYETKNLIKNVTIPYYIYEDGQTVVENPPAVENLENNYEQLISKIIFPDGEIQFLYSGDDGIFTTSDSQFRKDLNSNNGAVALKRMIVKNKAGKIIKDISFLYNYFESGSSIKKYVDYRLRLDQVKDNLENSAYTFTYNESYPLPARNANSDDYWGYFNSTAVSNTSIPRFVDGIENYSTMDYIPTGRDRNTNPTYAQMGTLTTIKYPTGAEKKLYYESNYITKTSQSTLPQISSVTSLSSDYLDVTNPLNQYYEVKESEYTFTPSDFQGKINPKIKLSFANGCYNGINDTSQLPPIGLDPDYSGPVGTCKGNWYVDENNWGAMNKNGIKYEISPTLKPFKLRLQRNDLCSCNISINLEYRELIVTNTESPVGGLRINKIEDVDNYNVSNTRQFLYNSSGALRKKFHFNRPFYRVMRPNPASTVISGADMIVENFRISSSGNAYTGYNSSDIVTYSKITEKTDLGETDYFFTNAPEGGTSIFARYSEPYNEWKLGLPVKTIIRKGTDTLKVQSSVYDFSPIKNSLSGYTSNDPESIAFAADFDMVKFHSFHSADPSMDAVGAIQIFNYNPIQILGGKIELKQTKVTEYFDGNKKIESQTENTYTDTDINKPINLKTTSSTVPSGENILTTYQYAHEKGNQLMISKNMIDTPLETSSVQTANGIAKTISRSQSIYPVNQGEADNRASGLVLPLSALSYDLQTGVSSTELIYDQYDSKGNIMQYTTKGGISVSIIWGYDKTKPIAKIEGAKIYDIPQALIDSIVNASNTDATSGTDASEQSLITALDTFRNNAGLSAFQISTYTYDPLIGVRSITPPSGIREFYKYDAANRLERVVDTNGKVLKEYQYHYKN